VPHNGSGHIARLFHRLQTWHALGAVALVAGNAVAHLVVPGLPGGDQHGAVVGGPGQPVACQQLSAAGFAAFLTAQDELGSDGV